MLSCIITFNRDKEVTPESLIPVEKIQAPVLLLSSKHDEVWPSFESACWIEKKLADSGFRYPHKHVAYEHISHAMTTKGSWLWKLGFRSERQHPKECEEDRTALQKELLGWVGRSWASEEQGEQNLSFKKHPYFLRPRRLFSAGFSSWRPCSILRSRMQPLNLLVKSATFGLSAAPRPIGFGCLALFRSVHIRSGSSVLTRMV